MTDPHADLIARHRRDYEDTNLPDEHRHEARGWLVALEGETFSQLLPDGELPS